MSEIVNLCGLWASKDKNGNAMMSGKLSFSSKVFVFKNSNKKKESEPDYFLKIAANEKEEPKVQEVQENIF